MEQFQRGLRRMADVVSGSNSPRSSTHNRGLSNGRNSVKTNFGWKYEPLSSEFHEIRMLTLIEGKSTTNTTMKCTMENVSLVDPGEYTALSYCWGDTHNPESIMVNDIKLRVTANLSGALEELFVHGHKRIWVDALCINQNDREERSLQVRNMRLVYSRAKMVVLWIGHAEERDALMIKIMLEDDYLLARRYNIWLKDNERASRLLYFFDNPYWKRVWIIQEVAVAENVTILYSSVRISWDALVRTLNRWRADPALAPIPPSSYSYALRLLDFRHKLSVANEPITLLEAIYWSHKSFATDPRDRIFALLGISVDGPTLVPLPNYKQSMPEVLTDLTFALMVADRSLDLICVKENKVRAYASSHPSWMLDLFEVWSQPTPLISHVILDERRNYSVKPFMERVKNGGLRVRGKVLDNIHALSSVAESGSKFQAATVPLVMPRYELYGSTAGINDAIWKSLTMGAFNNATSTETNNIFKSFRACFASLWTPESREFLKDDPLITQWLEQNASFSIGSDTIEERSQYKDQQSTWTSVFGRILGGSPETLAPQNMSYFVKSIRNVLEGSMRLMVTRKGFIGLAHPAANIGDEICFIAGCSVPVVLRRISGPVSTYRIIGGSYVHGISDTDEPVTDISLLGNQLRGKNESSVMFSATKEFILL